MALYTFISETRGSTILEQFKATSIEQAVIIWRARSKLHTRLPKIYKGAEFVEPVPVDGLHNVWCDSYSDKDEKPILIHIIKTAK